MIVMRESEKLMCHELEWSYPNFFPSIPVLTAAPASGVRDETVQAEWIVWKRVWGDEGGEAGEGSSDAGLRLRT